MTNLDPLKTRRALARLPRWTQPLWTWITGTALPGEAPRWRWSAGTHVLALLFVWLATLALGVSAVSSLLSALFGV